MHPMEYLRHVAGARGADASDLVHESAWALAAMASDPQALVLIVRRLVEKHPTCAPLWWLGAHTLTALDPVSQLRDVMADYAQDPTESHLVEMLAHADDSVTIVEALGCGIHDGLTEVMIADDDETERDLEVVVVRRGTVLPRDLWAEMKRRSAGERVEIVALTRFDSVVGPFGVVAANRAQLVPECEPCPEMLVASGL